MMKVQSRIRQMHRNRRLAHLSSRMTREVHTLCMYVLDEAHKFIRNHDKRKKSNLIRILL